MKTLQEIYAELPPPPPGKSGWPWTVDSVDASELLSASESEGLPSISIVTPSFNQGQYIEETIRSVLLQGYPKLEYLIIDGGSTDDSVEIIRKYEACLTYWVSEKDRGQSHAINKGLRRLSGEMIGYLNSDDLLADGALKRVADAAGQGIEWLAGQTIMFGEDVTPHRHPRPRTSKDGADILFTCPCAQPSTFWSRKLLDEAGFFDEAFRYAFDFEYWMRLRYNCGSELWEVPQVLSLYRLHASSKTVAEGHLFEAENRVIRMRYRKHLSADERIRLAIRVKNHCDMLRRRRAWMFLAEGKAFSGLLTAAGAALVAPWSVGAFRAILVALRNLLTIGKPRRIITNESSSENTR